MAARSLTVIVLLLLTVLPSREAKAESLVLITPVTYGTHLPGLGTPAGELAKLIKERSAGALALDLKQPGERTKPQEILDSVADGSVDAGFATASFWAAKIPAAALFSGFPFGPDANGYRDWLERGNGRKLYQELYDHAGFKVHVIPCAFGGAEAGGWFAKEIRSKEDIKGLRMRIFGLGARVMSKLGATTVLVPGGDLAQAFASGKIDAAELYTPAVDREQKLQDKVKLVYAPGWHQPETMLELIVNQDRWKGLSNQQRTLIEGACLAMLQSTLTNSARLQNEAMAELASKDGVRVETWPEEVLTAFRVAWAEVAKDEGDRDYFFKEVLEDIEKFRAKQADEPSPAATAPQVESTSTEPSLDRR
jgi:TRAP-type mannitol/chloroaromatic compound transport system substrate-binding protein